MVKMGDERAVASFFAEASMFKVLRSKWAGLCMALFFVLCVPACGPKESIRIGFVANLTGGNAALGVDGRDGALLAVEKINADGGVNGHPIELVIRDDLGTAEGAVAADQELIDDEKVSVIIGHMTSNTMMAAWPEFQNSGVVFLSPTVSTPQLAGHNDNFFRLIPINSTFSARLAEYASNDLSLRRVAIFYDTDNAAFTGTFRDGFVEEFVANGGTILMDHAFSSSAAPDFKPVLSDLKKLQPDAICIIASAVDTALIAQQSRLEGIDVQLLTSNWALTDDLIENGGRTVDGILTVVAHDETNRSPEYLDFSRQFQSRFGRQPTFAAGYGFESVFVLANAFEMTDGKTEGIKNALLQTKDLPGVNGHISFDPYGDVLRTLYLIGVEDGQFVTQKAFTLP
jgi:branched-chain amino acid transport system substrate-binding protein